MSSRVLIFYRQSLTAVSKLAVALLLATVLSGCSTFSRFDFPAFGLEKEVEDTASIRSENRDRGDGGEYYRSIYRSGGAPRSDIQRSDLPPDSLYDRSYRDKGPYKDRSRRNSDYDNGYRGSKHNKPYDSSPYQETYQEKQANNGTRYDSSKTIIVRPGDNLYRIARNNGVKLAELKRTNGLNSNNIRVGQELILPSATSSGYAERNRFKPTNKRKYGGYYTPPRSRAGQAYKPKKEQTPKVNRYTEKRHDVVRPPEILNGNSRSLSPDRSSAGTGIQTEQRDSSESRREEKVARVAPRRKIYNLPEGNGKFRWPANGRIISQFGIKKNGVRNDGLNLSLPVGTEIRAAESGIVAYAGNELKGYGKLVLIRHRNKWVSAYAHNSEILVRRGQKIRRGQVIARAGKSGSVNQPQLHFELRKGSKPVNPIKYLSKS